MDAKDEILRDELADLQARYQKQQRQLGGANAANNRKSGEIRSLKAQVAELKAENDKLKDVNGDLCERFNASEKRADEAEKSAEHYRDMCHGMYADISGVAPDLARVWERAYPWLGGGK